MAALTANLGFPRVGAQRELKTALEQCWQGKISEAELLQTAAELQQRHWKWQQEAGIELVPVGDFALYDHVLDTIDLLGAVPERYQQREWPSSLARYFAMARGTSEQGGIAAMEMTKWFNTNYHYIVPEWTAGQEFQLHPEKLLAQIEQARSLGIRPRPVILGPVSLLLLGKQKSAGANPEETLTALLSVYSELFELLAVQQIEHIQLDEPCLVLELNETQQNWFRQACQVLQAAAPGVNICLTSYFDGLDKNLPLAFSLPVQTVHLDLVAAPEQLETALNQIQPQQSLSLGLVNGRNVWKTDLAAAIVLAEKAVQKIGKDRILIASSCSLLHAPIDLELEKNLDADVKPWLAFAKQKLAEIAIIAKAINYSKEAVEEELNDNLQALTARRQSLRVVTPQVRQRLEEITPDMYSRESPFPARAGIQ